MQQEAGDALDVADNGDSGGDPGDSDGWWVHEEAGSGSDGSSIADTIASTGLRNPPWHQSRMHQGGHNRAGTIHQQTMH